MNEEVFLRSAQERAVKMGLIYTGALVPTEAFEYLQAVEGAMIVDVRTKPEINFVGRIPEAVEIEWQSYPDMQINEKFIDELKQAGATEDTPLLFICRSGMRSHNAALAVQNNGFHKVFSVLKGFEGDLDSDGHRSSVNGWRFCGLPWKQG